MFTNKFVGGEDHCGKYQEYLLNTDVYRKYGNKYIQRIIIEKCDRDLKINKVEIFNGTKLLLSCWNVDSRIKKINMEMSSLNIELPIDNKPFYIIKIYSDKEVDRVYFVCSHTP